MEVKGYGCLNVRDKGLSFIYGLNSVKNKIQRNVIGNEEFKEHKIISFVQMTSFIKDTSFLFYIAVHQNQLVLNLVIKTPRTK